MARRGVAIGARSQIRHLANFIFASWLPELAWERDRVPLLTQLVTAGLLFVEANPAALPLS
jgi:hypothetical protein